MVTNAVASATGSNTMNVAMTVRGKDGADMNLVISYELVNGRRGRAFVPVGYTDPSGRQTPLAPGQLPILQPVAAPTFMANPEQLIRRNSAALVQTANIISRRGIEVASNAPGFNAADRAALEGFGTVVADARDMGNTRPHEVGSQSVGDGRRPGSPGLTA